MCERPSRLSGDEAIAWLRRATEQLGDGRDVTDLRLVELEHPSLRWAGACDWMVEAQLGDGVDPRRLVANDVWRDLLADLRLLGMRPTLAVADAGRTSDLRAGR
jgi:hypothetical protein